jgi:hypothetical protein
MNAGIKNLSRKFLSSLSLLLGWAALPSSAQITATIEEGYIPAGTLTAPLYVIDSDSTNAAAGYTRDTILASADVQFTRPLSATTESEDYRLTAQLIDNAGNPVTLSNGTTSIAGPSQTVTFTPLQTIRSFTWALNIDPGIDLGAGRSYSIRYRIQFLSSNLINGIPVFAWFNTPALDNSPTSVITHFNDLPENTNNRFARGWLRAAPTITKSYAVSSGSGTQPSFTLSVPYSLARYDVGGSSASIPVRFTTTLTDDLGNVIPLSNGGVTTDSFTRAAFTAGAPNIPAIGSFNRIDNFTPTVQLDSRNRTYKVSVKFEHLETTPSTYRNNGTSPESALQRLLHFNGTLSFGTLATSFTSISNTPIAGALGTNLVNTTLNTTGGTIPGFPNYSFGAGSDLSVQLLSNGNANVTAGFRTVVVAGGGNVSATFGGNTVEYPNTQLTSTGPQAGSTVVLLPQGLSYTPNRNTAKGRYLSEVTLSGRTLTNLFRHTGTLTLATPASAWVFDEARPLLYQVSQFQMPQSGNLDFTSVDSEWANEDAFDQLDSQQASGAHQEPSMQHRMTNDGHLRFTSLNGTQTVRFIRHSDGTARTDSADLDVLPGAFLTHFPKNTECKWTGNGILKIRDGVISEDSGIGGAELTTVHYDGSCQGDACGPPPGSVTDNIKILPENNVFRYTSDGGIQAQGPIPVKPLKWGIRGDGTPAHRTDNFEKAHFLASGHQLYESQNPLASSGPLTLVAADLSPASLLLAAYNPAKHEEPVYSGSTNYRDGVGVYAGATLTVEFNGTIGASRLADMTLDYEYGLQEIVSKYYVRASGLSGRHVAAAGQFSNNAFLYGYNFSIDRFQLTYLSNTNEESWINGGVEVNYPSQFSQKFLGLTLTCTGALDQAQIDPDDSGAKPLVYWNGSFTPMAMRFAPQEGAGCYDDRFLTLGLVSGAANIENPLVGTLAFMPSGNIGTIADNIQGVDGRLGLPGNLRLDGPGDEQYNLTPVSKLYFNNPETSGAPASGYVSFATRANVPFFEDLKLHVMTSAAADIPAAVYVASGWETAGQTHFSNTLFDPTHDGFPTGQINVEGYRNPSSETSFVPLAKQSIFGLVPLTYPLKWSTTGRFFTSWQAVTNDLLVVNVEHQVDYLSADNAEISFGAQYDGLPEINLASAAFDVVDEQIGAAKALTEAAQQFVTDTLNQGVDEIGNLASDTLENVLDQAIDSMEDEVIDPLYHSIVTSYNNARAANQTYTTWVNSNTNGLSRQYNEFLDGSVGTAANSIKGRLNTLHSAANDASNLLKRVQQAVDQGILAIDSVTSRIQVVGGEVQFNLVPPAIPATPTNGIINGILAKVNNPDTGNLERQIVQSLVAELIRELAPPDLAAIINPLLADATSEINAELNTLLADFDPTLDRITEVLIEARRHLEFVRGKLASGQDIFISFQQIITAANAEITVIVNSIRTAGNNFFNQLATSATILPTTALNTVGSLINEFSKEEFVAFLRAEIRDRLLGSDFIQQIQYTLRQYISELDMAMRSAIDSAFAEVSRMCKELIKEALGPIDDAINGLIGDINSFVGAGSIDGYAHIQGDTLRRLRLDAKVQFKMPEEMELHAYFEMNCYDAGSTVGSAGCLEAGEQAVEVKIGAIDVPLDWVSPDLRANLEVRFSMQTAPTVRPKGIGGSIEMTGGELDFQSLKITAFAASVAVGSDECYLAATARVIISSYEAAGGIFFGRTCSIEPLQLVDPDVADLLGTPPFTGAYVYGEIWIPISEVILGIPASCLFRISAGVGAGAFYFAEGPTFGGKMLLGISGEALCIVSIRGEVSMIGVMTDGSLRFRGRGTLTGKAGYCPFCVKFKESATVTYQDGSWEIDY